MKTKVLILDTVVSRATLGTRIHLGQVSFESSLSSLFTQTLSFVPVIATDSFWQ